MPSADFYIYAIKKQCYNLICLANLRSDFIKFVADLYYVYLFGLFAYVNV